MEFYRDEQCFVICYLTMSRIHINELHRYFKVCSANKNSEFSCLFILTRYKNVVAYILVCFGLIMANLPRFPCPEFYLKFLTECVI